MIILQIIIHLKVNESEFRKNPNFSIVNETIKRKEKNVSINHRALVKWIFFC